MARYRPGVDKSGNWWLKIVLKICVDTPIVDTNKIDNDHTYVALDHMHRYVVADEKDIQAG